MIRIIIIIIIIIIEQNSGYCWRKCPGVESPLSQGNHTDFRNAVEGPNRHSWASAYGPIHREERGQRCGPRAAPRYKLVMQIHSLYFTTGLQHSKNTLNPNNSPSSRDQKSLGDQYLIKYI